MARPFTYTAEESGGGRRGIFPVKTSQRDLKYSGRTRSLVLRSESIVLYNIMPRYRSISFVRWMGPVV